MTSPLDPHTKCYSHINDGTQALLDRFAVSELCKGWPVYRDASEWKNFRSLFTDDATVWTTWSGPRSIDDFIAISKAGKENGAFIMHRECGTLVELSSDRNRAIGKMKATITQRFRWARGGHCRDETNGTTSNGTNGTETKVPVPTEFDVDCDCRFIFFCEKNPTTGEWKTKYVKLFYEKDKVVPVNACPMRHSPKFSPEELAKYPVGYRYLGAAQARLGYKIDCVLPTASGELWDRMYAEMEKWLDGKEVDLFWEHGSEQK